MGFFRHAVEIFQGLSTKLTKKERVKLATIKHKNKLARAKKRGKLGPYADNPNPKARPREVIRSMRKRGQ